MSNVVAPTVTPPQPNPFEQAVIQAATAAAKTKPQTHEPPKQSITISTPAPPPQTPLPQGPKFSTPIPGMPPTTGANLNAAAGNPAQPVPTPDAPPGPPVNPDLQAQAAASQQQSADANKAITALLAQQPAAPAPYQQPAPPKNMGQDIGTMLGAALFPKAAPAFARQANDIQAQRDKTHTEDIAAETAKVAASQNAQTLATTGWNDKLTALRNQAAQGDAHAKALVDEYDREQLNAAKTREADEKLAQAATKIADNRTRFASTFAGTMAKLGFEKDKWGDQRALDAAKQASLDTYRYQALGLRTQNAYNIAQLRAASQMVIDTSRMADADKRANAGNALRADLANNKDLQAGAAAAVRTIDSWTKTTMALPPAQRAAAVAQMNQQLSDPASPLGTMMANLKQQGVFGDSVGDALNAEIQSTVAGQGVGPGGGITQNFNLAPAAAPAAPAAPVAAPPVQPPAATPHLPPGAKVGTIHLKAGGDVQGYTIDGHQYFTMDGKPI